MKILYVTTIGNTMVFFKDFIRHLLDEGHIVDIATNENSGDTLVPDCYRTWGCKVYPLDCSRSPMDMGNIRAVRQIRQIVKEDAYNLVHCHTPIAAACTRLACQPLRKNDVKVIYTAHGFHFFNGAPLKNWLIYYPIEKICSCFTDILITINKEDYARAKKKFHARQIKYVPGVGIDLDKFNVRSVDRNAMRMEFGIPLDARVVLSVGEVNANKNHRLGIEALAKLGNPNVYYIVCGSGNLIETHKALARELGIEKQVVFAGYRTDVAEFYNMANVFFFPSYREGLSVSLMEAMACGLPCVVSRIRGNVDLIDDAGGALFDPHSIDECLGALKNVLRDDCAGMGEHNAEKVKQFDLKTVIAMMDKVYEML